MSGMISVELLIGIGIGLGIAVVLLGSQNTVGRLAPCGCMANMILGLILLAAGIALLLIGGYVRLGG
jgi:hypothetical protein